MDKLSKKEVFRIMSALAVLLFIFGLSYFAGNDESVLNFKPSVEVGIFSLSPSGPSGGRIIPASCPSYEHFPGECTPAPTADIRANSSGDTNWTNGSDGPLNLPINPSFVTVTWRTTGGLTYSCTVTKNSGSCGLGVDGCSASNTDPNNDNATSTPNNSGPLSTGTYNYTIVCTDSIGRTASDVVYISVGSTPARYICSQGMCIQISGPGLNTGGCSVGRLGARCALTQCNDGIDNDGDGKTDFPADLGCTSVNDNNEGNIPGVFKECDPGKQTCD